MRQNAVLLVAGFCLAVTPAIAQEDAKWEGVAYAGLYHSPGATKPTVGVQGGFLAISHLRVFGELNYVPLGSASSSASGGGETVSGSGSARMVNFGGGADYTIPINNDKLQPYGLFVLGDGHTTASYSESESGSTSYSASGSSSANSFYLGFGGGVRYFLKPNLGIRPEFRYQRYTGYGGFNSIQLSAGLFYRFGGK
jgi:opacity protein-like surface antigen